MQAACEAVDGSFGSTEGNTVTVVFGYEVETEPTSQGGSLASAVLPDLEDAFVAFLLPAVFPDTCAAAATTFSSGGGRRRLEVIGIDKSPEDVPAAGVQCQQLDVPGNNCTFVDGSLTLHIILRIGESIESFRVLILERLRQGMEADAFVSAHPSIERVTFILGIEGPGPDPDPVPTNAPSTDSSLKAEDDDDLEWWPFLVGGSVLFMMCTGLLVHRRKMTGRVPAT